jgi:hypothetical protein
LDQTCEHRRLRRIERVRWESEIPFRGRLHAVCLLAEVGAVEVSGEGRRLAVAILELDRHGGVFELRPESSDFCPLIVG